jgi:O-antigen/teichoic acid export membrane protein
MEFNNGIEVATTGIQQLGLIIILSHSRNLYTAIYWYAACYYFRILIYFIFSARFFSLRALVPGFSLAVIKKNLKFGTKMFLVTMISSIYRHADKVIISKILPISELGYYSISFSTIKKGRMITGAISQAVYPHFSSLHSKKDRINLLRQYRKLQDLICYGIVPFYAFIIFGVLPVFSIILNAEIAQRLLPTVAILCLGFFMQTAALLPHYFSLAVGKPGIAMRTNTFVLVINLPLTVLLIHLFGLLGAALSLVSSRMVAYIYGIPKICEECLGITAKGWFLHISRIAVLVVFTYGFGWIMLALSGNYTVINLSFAYVVSTLGFLTGAFFLIGNEIRHSISHKLQMIRTVFKIFPM